MQVSPPSKHIAADGYPWWQRYQPVSYSLDGSRSGSESEFKEMVDKCNNVGVRIYVDAVINHMAAGKDIQKSVSIVTILRCSGANCPNELYFVILVVVRVVANGLIHGYKLYLGFGQYFARTHTYTHVMN